MINNRLPVRSRLSGTLKLRLTDGNFWRTSDHSLNAGVANHQRAWCQMRTHPLSSVDCLVNTARYPQSSRAGSQGRLLSSLSVFHALFFFSICPHPPPHLLLSSWGDGFLPALLTLSQVDPLVAPPPRLASITVWFGAVPSGHVIKFAWTWPWTLDFCWAYMSAKGASTSGVRGALVQLHTNMMAEVCQQFKKIKINEAVTWE